MPPPSDPAVADAAVSDLDYLKRRVVSEISSDEEEEEEEDEKEDGRSSERRRRQRRRRRSPPPPPHRDGQGDGAAAAAAAVAAAAAGARTTPSNGGSGLDLEAELRPAAAASSCATCRSRRPRTTSEPCSRSTATLGALGAPSVHVVLDRVSRQSRGIALVQLFAPAAAAAPPAPAEGSKAAADALGGGGLGGPPRARRVHLPGQAPPRHARRGPRRSTRGKVEGRKEKGGEGRSTRERRRHDLQGCEGGVAPRRGRRRRGGSKAWNSLFMRQDTVAAAVAAHFGVSKSDLLSRDAGDSPAVRLALGEAHVIAATKAALAAAGVDVARLEASAAAAGSGGRGKERSSRFPRSSAPPRPC